MNATEVLETASAHLQGLSSHVFDVLTISKPISPNAAVNLAKVLSKLSPLLGNLIEFNVVEFLNKQDSSAGIGTWKRQDPGFPDTIFEGSITPTPGFEIKAWFPLATEITARFRESQNHFLHDQTKVCMLAWLPDQLIFGKPRIIDVCIVSGLSVAKARDSHYHNPPDYLVLEPEDTKARARNLQQTNTNGYKFQGTRAQFAEAEKIVATWGPRGRSYKPKAQYQALLRELLSRFKYRLDTNFAKMDRVVHQGIEDFKARVLGRKIHSLSISEWSTLLYNGDEKALRQILEAHLKIKEEDADKVLR